MEAPHKNNHQIRVDLATMLALAATQEAFGDTPEGIFQNPNTTVIYDKTLDPAPESTNVVELRASAQTPELPAIETAPSSTVAS